MASSVSQAGSGLSGGVWGGWDDSCHLLSRKYTRDPPHSKHPNAHLPFLSTASHPVQFSPQTSSDDFSEFMSSCVGRITSQPCDRARSLDTDFGMFMRHAGRILTTARKVEIMPRMPLPPRVKSAVSRQNQHLTSRHGGNLDLIHFCLTEEPPL